MPLAFAADRHRAARNTSGRRGLRSARLVVSAGTPRLHGADSGLRAVITEKPLLPALAAHVEAELLSIESILDEDPSPDDSL